jgi:Ca-activated chloride channel family protein
VSEKDQIMSVINSLYPQNSTNAEAGLRNGYAMAERYRLEGQATRVVLLSDGVANVGVTDPNGILATIQGAVDRGITLTTIGVGMGNYNDVLMEQLANDGNGNYYYVDTLREAQRVFVFNLVSTLQVIAYDAKIQVAFNPEAADRYRLIGYENRPVADSDFRNDTIDAGEVGAGQSATALYEIALENRDLAPATVIATVYVRYQEAETRQIKEISVPLRVGDLLSSVEEAPPSFRLAAAAAEFAELLRGSYWAQEGNYVDLLAFAQPLEALLPNDPAVRELIELIKTAGRYVDR